AGCTVLRIRTPPTPPLLPYTTLFRSPWSRPEPSSELQIAVQVHCSDQHDYRGFHVPAGRQHRPHRSPNNYSEPQRFSFRSSLGRSEEHTSELQSRFDLVCRLLLDKKK